MGVYECLHSGFGFLFRKAPLKTNYRDKLTQAPKPQTHNVKILENPNVATKKRHSMTLNQ